MIIILTGQKRSGKSTASKFFVEQGFKELALANGFKRDLAFVINQMGIFESAFTFRDANAETDFDREYKYFNKEISKIIVYKSFLRILGDSSKYFYLEDEIYEYFDNDPRKTYSFRELMQIIGTDIGCNIVDKHIWTKLVFSKIIDSNNDKFIIPDVRQQHEIDLFRKLGATIIHIKRPGLNSNDSHITEKELDIDEKDHILINDKSYDEFLDLVKNLYNQVTKE